MKVNFYFFCFKILILYLKNTYYDTLGVKICKHIWEDINRIPSIVHDLNTVILKIKNIVWNPIDFNGEFDQT
jgi:hypothetical protein